MKKTALQLLLLSLCIPLMAGELGCPLADCSVISSPFGQTTLASGKIRLHTGVDFVIVVGAPVRAASDGKVLKAGIINGYGTRVMIEHKNSLQTLYAHLSKLVVEKGQRVKKGDVIGYSGNTGKSSAPHLHFGVYKDSRMVDPKGYIQ